MEPRKSKKNLILVKVPTGVPECREFFEKIRKKKVEIKKSSKNLVLQKKKNLEFPKIFSAKNEDSFSLIHSRSKSEVYEKSSSLGIQKQVEETLKYNKIRYCREFSSLSYLKSKNFLKFRPVFLRRKLLPLLPFQEKVTNFSYVV